MADERPCFLASIEQCRLPTLTPGDIVIMDNLSSHKGPAMQAALERVGATLRFLPPYSPELNPIEQGFAKLKLCSVTRPNGPLKRPGGGSEPCWTATAQPNATITSPMPAMNLPKHRRL